MAVPAIRTFETMSATMVVDVQEMPKSADETKQEHELMATVDDELNATQ